MPIHDSTLLHHQNANLYYRQVLPGKPHQHVVVMRHTFVVFLFPFVVPFRLEFVVVLVPSLFVPFLYVALLLVYNEDIPFSRGCLQ